MKIRLNFVWIISMLMFMACNKDDISITHDEDIIFTKRAKKQFVPLKGNYILLVVPGSDPTTFNGEGNITHLGKVSVVDVLFQGNPLTGQSEITAANGDLLKLSFAGGFVGPPGPNGEFNSKFDFMITEGTGRFINAQGSGQLFGSGQLGPFPLHVTIEGQIKY